MLLIPATIQVAHAFEHHDHDHEVITSLNGDQFHAEDDCTLCDFIMDSSGLVLNESPSTFFEEFSLAPIYFDTFQVDSEELSYSLRGPPAL